MFERFTDRSRLVVKGAQDLADEMGHRHVGTEHLLLAILAQGGGIAHDVLRAEGLDAQQIRAAIAGPPRLDADALESIGIDLNAVRAKIEETFGPGALDEDVPHEERHGLLRKRYLGGRFTPRAKVVLELSLREALALKHKHIGTEHILLGLLREGKGLAAKVLADAGLDFAGLRAKTIAAIPKAHK
jgi:ATP-dependent Clp protease ATP-binding subunit ClpA